MFLVNMHGFFHDKKGVSIVNPFQSLLKKSNRKPNKI